MLRLFDRLKLTPAERRLVMVIIAVAFLVLNYWLVWPRFSDFRIVSEDLEALKRKRELYQREIERRPNYEVALRKLQAQGSVIPAGEERIQFRSDMERLAREVGLSVPSWSEVLPERGGTTTNAFFEAIGLTMSRVTGTEAQLVDFLHRVGASNSTIRVKELMLTPGNFDARAQGRTNLIATIKLVASVQKAAPMAPAAGTGTPAGAAASAPAPGRTNAAFNPGPRTNAIPTPVRAAPRTNMQAPVPTKPAS